MSEYRMMARRQRKWMLYILALFVLGASLTPYSRIFLGLILGGTVSFYNLWLLQRKINDFGTSVILGGKPKGLGTAARFAAAILATLLAIRFPEYFSIVALVCGLLISYPIMFVDLCVYHWINQDEEGETDES